MMQDAALHVGTQHTITVGGPLPRVSRVTIYSGYQVSRSVAQPVTDPMPACHTAAGVTAASATTPAAVTAASTASTTGAATQGTAAARRAQRAANRRAAAVTAENSE